MSVTFNSRLLVDEDCNDEFRLGVLNITKQFMITTHISTKCHGDSLCTNNKISRWVGGSENT